MGEFSLMEDWDLQAVVRGCSNYTSEMINSSQSLFSPLGFDQDEIFSFNDMFQFGTDLLDDDKQKEIYMPNSFYSPAILSPSSSISIPSCEVKNEPEKLQKINYPLAESATPVSPMASKSRKSRKNQQKKVVKHVAADGLSSDMWAWRKYGQKPIKGSPYPRSYYRCSSLKGCLARKQVERSSKDPSIFIITYTAEHSHAHPTRRNSLAGTTRIKPPMPKQTTIKEESLANSQEDDFVQQVRIKNEEQEQEQEEHVLESNSESNEIGMPEIMFSEDLFPSLEELEGLFLDQFSATVP